MLVGDLLRWTRPSSRRGLQFRQLRRCGTSASTARKERTGPAPASHLPTSQKLLSFWPCPRAGMQSVEILLQQQKQPKREKKGRETEPNVYLASQKPPCSHSGDGITLAHTKKCCILMTKPCLQIKECERKVKRSTRSRLHAFFCCDLREMQRQAGGPLVSKKTRR